MAAVNQIGVVRDRRNGKILATINDDIDNPKWLSMRDNHPRFAELVKLAIEDVETADTLDKLKTLIDKLQPLAKR
jgi:hypothetical protein